MKKLYSFTVLLSILLITFLVYENHFNNTFHFDDFHTIVDNLYIRDIKNIPSFFSNAQTTSTLPANQAYRPGLTTLNAIDFYLAGKPTPEPFMFHVNIFLCFLILGILCYFIFLHLLQNSLKNCQNTNFALFATAWFLLHTANAETINYIIARSDSFSTLTIALSFVLYFYFPKSHKFYLYFLPSFLGFFVKELTMMFIPLLGVYKLLFEQKLSVKQWFSSKFFTVFKQVALPLLLSITLFLFSRTKTPTQWDSGGAGMLQYLFTQPFVMFHYAYNFVLPINLVVDSDWNIIPFRDDRVLAGLLFVLGLLIVAYKCSFNLKNRPITFGILWFFIALLPTSSIFSFAEVLNDHRTFFPYIGLFIACSTYFRNIIVELRLIEKTTSKWAIITAGCIFLTIHGYGTRQRNKIWATEELLWQECTIKAPNNGRGWMNYGLALMQKGDYINAIFCFQRTLTILPSYAYGYINMGIAKGALGDKIIAEANFKKGIELNPSVPEAYNYYAQFLLKTGRIDEAKQILQKGLSLSKNHQILLNTQLSLKLRPIGVVKRAKVNPTPENYLNLSLEYYNKRDFQRCINAANEALKLRPNYDLAYNNICAAYNRLGDFEKAIKIGEKGLKINPNNQLLSGNLLEAYQKKK
jgi:tetratricopeptide (TPR) repeat protein